MSNNNKPNLKVVKGGASKGGHNDAPKTEGPKTVPKGQSFPEVKPMDTVPVDRHAIREVRNYVDNRGREVNEFIQMFGKNKDSSFYKGRAVVQIRVAGPDGTQMQPQHQSFEFDIEATGLKKAFEIFDETAEAELSKMREQQVKDREAQLEAQKNAALDAGRIATPGGGRKPGIVGPDGRPVIS